jgi:hypothetical protein
VYLNRVGENAKFELVGDRLGAILGVVVPDDAAKLAASSIYSARKRWPVNRAITRGGGKEKGTGASARWLLPWRSLRRSLDAPSMTIRDVVKCPDTRRKTERRRFTGEVFRSGRGNLVRWWDLFMAGVIHDGDICVTLSAIQTIRTPIAATTTRIATEGRWR